jgi:hypothetical protein
MCSQRGLHLSDVGLAPDEAIGCRPQVARTRIERTPRRELDAQAGRPQLKHRDRVRHIPQPSRPQIEQINSAEQNRRRVGHQDLATVPGSHHPRGAVEHGAEVVPVPQLGLPSRNAHPHRQLQRPL